MEQMKWILCMSFFLICACEPSDQHSAVYYEAGDYLSHQVFHDPDTSEICAFDREVSQVYQDLLITEVGEPREGYPDWVELYNTSNVSVDLGAYSIEAPFQNASGIASMSTRRFTLPSVSVAPHTYIVLESAVDGSNGYATHHWPLNTATPQRVKVPFSAEGYTLSLRHNQGALVLRKEEQVIDALAYGQLLSPLPVSIWQALQCSACWT